jgi:ribosomal-protein-alanine N-acetyltransferase
MPMPVAHASAANIGGPDAIPLVRLERPGAWREREFLAAALRSRALHRGLVTVPATAAEYRDYLSRGRSGERESYFVVTAATDELAGVVDINDIVRDARPSGRLGYYAFVPFASRGLMREGLALVVARAFRHRGLRRLDAHVQPGNRRSIALLERLGFRREGTERGYLKIGTRWRDHERWQLCADDWR